MIRNDPGLEMRVGFGQLTEAEIDTAADAAGEMNDLIEEAIYATGVANNGQINRADARDIQDYLHSNYGSEWAELHGTHNNGQPTGFHLVRNWGHDAELFGKHAICHVAEDVYQFGFDIDGITFQHPGGEYGQSLNVSNKYLGLLLAGDLQAGTLANSNVVAYREGTTDTGLDVLVNTITEDPGLQANIPTSEIAEGALAADLMNHILIDAIKETDAADDGSFDAMDIRGINTFIRQNHLSEWIELHGDDEGDEETGFHLVQNDGGTSKLLNKAAVNTIADEIYHLGFEINGITLENEDGDANQSINVIAGYLNNLLAADLADGSLAGDVVSQPSPPPSLPTGGTGSGGETNAGTDTDTPTGTGLDAWVNIILNDPAWPTRIGYGLLTQEDVEAGADAANGMNHIIVESIIETGVANDSTLNGADMRLVNEYIRTNHLEDWIALHGDDEGNVETGFHRVQGDGASSKLYGKSAVDSVMDETYHLGFEIVGRFLYNEDGNVNQSINVVASYLNQALAADLANGSLSNDTALPDIGPLTGTGLDDLITIILEDPGLNAATPVDEVYGGAAARVHRLDGRAGAAAANAMNHILVEGINATGIGGDGLLTGADMRDLNAFIRGNYLNQWTELHGDDEGGQETGFHLVQGDGGTTTLFGKRAIDSVMDETYHLGFLINGLTLENEDGDANQSINVVASYLDRLLEEELANGEFDAIVA